MSSQCFSKLILNTFLIIRRLTLSWNFSIALYGGDFKWMVWLTPASLYSSWSWELFEFLTSPKDSGFWLLLVSSTLSGLENEGSQNWFVLATYKNQLDEEEKVGLRRPFPTLLEKEDLYPLATFSKPMILRSSSSEHAVITKHWEPFLGKLYRTEIVSCT